MTHDRRDKIREIVAAAVLAAFLSSMGAIAGMVYHNGREISTVMQTITDRSAVLSQVPALHLQVHDNTRAISAVNAKDKLQDTEITTLDKRMTAIEARR